MEEKYISIFKNQTYNTTSEQPKPYNMHEHSLYALPAEKNKLIKYFH